MIASNWIPWRHIDLRRLSRLLKKKGQEINCSSLLAYLFVCMFIEIGGKGNTSSSSGISRTSSIDCESREYLIKVGIFNLDKIILLKICFSFPFALQIRIISNSIGPNKQSLIQLNSTHRHFVFSCQLQLPSEWSEVTLNHKWSFLSDDDDEFLTDKSLFRILALLSRLASS